MATLHLICGLPCAGKTTLARQLEREYGALRLTPDEWHTQLFGQDAEETGHDARHALIEALLWDVAARALVLGVNVILDYGFWARSEREDYRSRARQLGATTCLHFVDATADQLLQRLEVRNAQQPSGAFQIRAEKLQKWIDFFQRPTPDELRCWE